MAAGGRRPEGQGCSVLGSSTQDAECPAAATDSAQPAEPAALSVPPPPPPELPTAFSHRVPHFQQVHNWDCGLACVLMVLRALGMRQHNMATLQQLCTTQSIWTIDLAHLLATCGARVQMLTVTIGANQAYSGERFYADHMPSDSSRVEQLFREAPAAGIPVHQRSLPLADLKALLLGGTCLPLVLVDKITLSSTTAAQHSSCQAWQCAAAGADGSDLQPSIPDPARSCGGAGARAAGQEAAARGPSAVDICSAEAQQQAAVAAAASHAAAARSAGDASPLRQGVPMPPSVRISSPGWRRHSDAAAVGAAASGARAGVVEASSSCPGSPPGYLGHYVVLVGYDSRSDEFEYRDPSSDRARLWMPAQRLEAARKCFGTDEDLLLVEVPCSSTHCSNAGSSSSEGGIEAEAVAAEGEWLSEPDAPMQRQQQPDDWGAASASPRIVYG